MGVVGFCFCFQSRNNWQHLASLHTPHAQEIQDPTFRVKWVLVCLFSRKIIMELGVYNPPGAWKEELLIPSDLIKKLFDF